MECMPKVASHPLFYFTNLPDVNVKAGKEVLYAREVVLCVLNFFKIPSILHIVIFLLSYFVCLQYIGSKIQQ